MAQELWMSFAQSVESRDKFLRSIFFGAKMLTNYGADSLGEEATETLNIIQNTVSTSRKAFR